MPTCRRLLAFMVFVSISSIAHAGDWPQLRGRGGAATAADSKLPIHWSDSNVLWNTPIPGPGISSPAVSGDAVYITYSNADGTQRTLARYNAGTGAEEWKRTLPFHTHAKHKKNSFATGTPAIDGDRVVVLFADGEKFLVSCYSTKGDLLWQKDVGGFNADHGFGGSPIIEGGKVYFAKEQDVKPFDPKGPFAKMKAVGSSLYAFSLKTGEKVWQTDYRVSRATYSTPTIYRGPDGQTCLVCSHSFTGLAGYDLQTGKRLWKCDGFELRTVGMPIQSGTIVAATAGEGGGGKTFLAVDLASSPTGDAELQPVYTLNKEIPYCPTPIAVGDRFYFVTDIGTAGCVDAKSGKVIWSERLGSKHAASPVFANGAIFFLSEDGDVKAIKPGDHLEKLAAFHLNDHFLATPAVVDGRMYLRGEANLWCIGAK